MKSFKEGFKDRRPSQEEAFQFLDALFRLFSRIEKLCPSPKT